MSMTVYDKHVANKRNGNRFMMKTWPRYGHCFKYLLHAGSFSCVKSTPPPIINEEMASVESNSFM